MNNWVSTVGDQCLENVRPRSARPNEFNLCSTQHDICSICTSCGSDFPDETGAFPRSIHPNWYSARGAQCSGTFMTKRSAKEG